MSFPTSKYDSVLGEAMKIVANRNQQGRNLAVEFYDGFPHGHADVSFELWRRVARILGAEKAEKLDTARADALDLLNYAAFYVMLLDRHNEKWDLLHPPPSTSGDVKAETYHSVAFDYTMEQEDYVQNSRNPQPRAVGCDGAD